MSTFNRQLPPDTDFDTIMASQTNAENIETKNKTMYDIRHYLDFKVPAGQTTVEKTIRLLPLDPETKELFKIVKVHNIAVDKALNPNKSGKKAYVCLDGKNNIDHETFGSKCPICEEQSKLWQQWHAYEDEIKKIESGEKVVSEPHKIINELKTKENFLIEEIKKLNTNDVCYIRCIERGKEEDGPKFWKFNLRKDKTDPYHTMLSLAEIRKAEGQEAGVDINIFSIYNGRDLKITFSAEGTAAPKIVDKSISTPITPNNEELIKWYYDEKKWSDVFSIKPYDYLNVVFKGEIPWFDIENKKWISKTEFENKKKNITLTANEEIKNAEQMFVGSPILTTEKPIITTSNPSPFTPPTTTGVNKTPTVTATNGMYSMPDDDLPF